MWTPGDWARVQVARDPKPKEDSRKALNDLSGLETEAIVTMAVEQVVPLFASI